MDAPLMHLYNVLVHESGQHGEGRARLGHDGDGHGRAHAVLPLLDLEGGTKIGS